MMGPVLPIAASLNTEFTEITASVAALTAQGNPDQHCDDADTLRFGRLV